MRALTVQQPWAWAIVRGAKLIENRTQWWRYTGTLMIHAGARLSERGCELLPFLLEETAPELLEEYLSTDLTYGAVLGVVDLVDSHFCTTYNDQGVDTGVPCCAPWGEHEYVAHDGRLQSRIVHMELEEPRPLINPVPAKGRLGLWSPGRDLEALVRQQIVLDYP